MLISVLQPPNNNEHNGKKVSKGAGWRASESLEKVRLTSAHSISDHRDQRVVTRIWNPTASSIGFPNRISDAFFSYYLFACQQRQAEDTMVNGMLMVLVHEGAKHVQQRIEQARMARMSRF